MDQYFSNSGNFLRVSPVFGSNETAFRVHKDECIGMVNT
jgi:hypothetical protein